MDKIKAAEERYSIIHDYLTPIKRSAFIAGWDAALSTHQQLLEANQGLREALEKIYSKWDIIDEETANIAKQALEKYKL